MKVSHLVLMKPRAELTHADRQAFVDAFDRAMREIPTVRGVRIGRRLTHGAGYESSVPAMDYVAIIEFDVDDMTEVEIRSHRLMEGHTQFFRRHAPGFERATNA